MAKRALIVLSLVIVALTVKVGTQAAFTHTQNGQECLPGTQPALDLHQLYLPLVACTDRQPSSPPPSPICIAEEESNDVHDVAQAVVASCVEGDTDGYGDLDWYELNVCSGPIDQVLLSLDGPEDGANLDLYLYADPPGWPLYSSEGAGADETITATNVLTGVYYALVQPLAGEGDYVLTVAVSR
jgi:hypothetical protein